jgi:hypothetical protein
MSARTLLLCLKFWVNLYFIEVKENWRSILYYISITVEAWKTLFSVVNYRIRLKDCLLFQVRSRFVFHEQKVYVKRKYLSHTVLYYQTQNSIKFCSFFDL